MSGPVTFETELDSVLPQDLPMRGIVVAKAAAHLTLIEQANRQFNLTRITDPREAAIKHVLDSVIPWRLFAGAKHVLDAGTGAGFPGIPLALTLPDVQFTLAESTHKKARVVGEAVHQLGIRNARIEALRAEEILGTRRFDIVTARAVAPIERAVELFKGATLLLYKGPDAEQEIAEAKRSRVKMEIVMRYELPDNLGSRTIVRCEL
jgi:16S rRNA (guanine527-N7)-methyltransferase